MSIRSLRTGVSGLDANQTRLNVISNNISNVNTTGFKKSRAAFAEALGQEVQGANRSVEGGTNPSKVGRGVTVADINRNFSQGSLNQTGVRTDLALQGDGFFVAQGQEGSQRRLTRAGDFTFDENGELVTNGGLNVQGWTVGEDGKAQTGELQDIKIDPNAQISAEITENASVGGNLTADATDGDTFSIATSVFDSQGNSHDVVVNFTKNSSANEWSYEVESTDDGVFGGGSPVADGSLTFDSDGSLEQIDGSSDKESITLDWSGETVDESSEDKQLEVDLSQLTQFGGSTTAKFQSKDGNTSGELAGFDFTGDGKLQLNYTNGETEQTYQLAIGNVNNPGGLEQQGQNLFTTTSASGSLQLGRAGRDLRTSVVSGSLEQSNVQLSEEFADLIETQRAFQSSSRVVTTADEVLQQTVQLKQ